MATGPVTIALGAEVHRTQFDARVEFVDRPAELREIKESEESLSVREEHQRDAQARAAEQAGFVYRRLTRTDLDAHRQLIHNWRRALGFLAASRHLVLSPFRDELMRPFRTQPRLRLQELLRGTDPALEPVYVAASFSALQAHLLTSDLDCAPLSLQTWFTCEEPLRV